MGNIINTTLQMKKQRHREVRTLIQNHTACRSCSLPLLSPGQCLGWPQWSLKAVPALSSVKAMASQGQATGSGAGRRWHGPPRTGPRRSLASGGVLGLAAAHRLCAPSTGLSPLPRNCNVGGRSGKHIVCRRKPEWFFLFLKVVMVQLVAKPLPPLPLLASPSFPLPPSLLGISGFIREPIPLFPPLPPRKRSRIWGQGHAMSPGTPGPRAVSLGPAGFGDSQGANHCVRKGR